MIPNSGEGFGFVILSGGRSRNEESLVVSRKRCFASLSMTVRKQSGESGMIGNAMIYVTRRARLLLSPF
jgi:hypothetical protein